MPFLRCIVLPTLIAALALAGSAAGAATLYDPALGTLPAAQGWLTRGNGPHEQGIVAGRYEASTLPDESTSFGSARRVAQGLDTGAGVIIEFDLRVEAETHATPNRAGFSLIATGADPRQAIEIAFWTDRVWAYAYDPANPDRFVHGAEALWDTASTSHDYVVTLQNQRFGLAADGRALISGALVDYGAQGLPYSVPDFLFVGDDTSRAASRIELGEVSSSAVPEPAAAAMWIAGIVVCVGAAVGPRTRR